MCHNFYLLEELRVNVAPILIDEIDEEFFSNKDRGNNLIVNVSNLSTSNFDFTPCFIGTTNALEYSLPQHWIGVPLPKELEHKKTILDFFKKKKSEK